MNNITDQETNVDLFHLDSYIKGLSSFAGKCQTPMTIAIQGSWGSGKSSMMSMLEDRIQKTDNNAIFVHFNTWQYSQFSFSGQLPMIFLSGLIEKISDVEVENRSKPWANTILENGKSLLKLLTAVTAGDRASELVGDLIDSRDKNLEEDKNPSAVRSIENLKGGFADLVSKRCAQEGKDRVIFFIDDLDRLQPQKAVELMEILKIIIECKNCVFVLAIDYDVVSRGVRSKYGSDINETKIRSFFDKIIQVPFSLPISKYDLSAYINQLIDSAGLNRELNGIRSKDNEISADYIQMIRYSIGGNPRSIKRLLNTFRLLTYINQEADGISYPILFITLCLQLSHEKIYNYLLNHCEDKRSIDQVFQAFSSVKNLQESDSLFKEKVAINDYTEAELTDTCQFFDSFYTAILNMQQPDDSSAISDATAALIQQTLFTSSITATAPAVESNNVTAVFDTKVNDIYDMLTHIMAQHRQGREVNNRLINESRNIVAKKGNKSIGTVSSANTRGLGITGPQFQDLVIQFAVQKNPEPMIAAIMTTNKNKSITTESLNLRFSELLG